MPDYDCNYESGSVLTDIRHYIGKQGNLSGTSSLTDLAISGSGFFIVSDPGGTPFLTRAGSFIPDDTGQLVNAAGFTLLGYPLAAGQPGSISNSFDGLVPVNLENLPLVATPSTDGAFIANLPADAGVINAADLPSTNGAGSVFNQKSSLITYDNLGAEVKLDIYFAKTADSAWEMTVFDGRDASTTSGFPYGSAPLAVKAISFGPDGQLPAGGTDTASFTIPGGADFTLDFSGTTQLAADYAVRSASANGMLAGEPKDMKIAPDGVVYGIYDDGARVPVYQIPLAHVTSPDLLTPLAGNIYEASTESGDIQVGFAQSAGLGSILSDTLEQSTVDLASELTEMIDAQRSYTANSKVFQTGSELMDVLVNLKR